MPTTSPTDSTPAARLDRLLKYLELDPANPALRREASDACLALGRADEALAHAEAGLVAAPNEPHLLNAKALALMALGRHADAIPLLVGLLHSHPDPHIAFSLAYAQLQSGNAGAARDILAAFINGEPAAALAALWIRTLHHLAELEPAVAFARAHEPRFAADAAFLSSASLAYFDDEAFEDAERASRAALALDARSVEALLVRGSLALARLDAASALADFEEALRLRPNEGRAASGVGMAKLLAHDGAGARDALRQATALMPQHIGTWQGLGWACIALQAWDEARAAMEKALELDRNFGESHGAVAVVASLTGRREDAQAAIERALRLDPRNLSAQYAQMVMTGDAADPAKFEQATRRVLSSRSLPAGLTLRDLLVKKQ